MITKRIERAEVNGAPPPHVGDMYDGVIYPASDGEPMADSAQQFKAITYAESALTIWFEDAPDVYVAGDMFVYYRWGDIDTRVAPDVFVVEGAKGKHLRRSWVVWDEGAVPSFVLEVASESTWERDAGEKRRIYAEMGVLEYWRFDPENGKYFREILIGERLVDGEYVPLEVRLDEDGTLRGYSEFLRLDVCVLPDGRLRLYDPVAGEWRRSHDESERERIKAIHRADENARRADENARRANENARRADENARERDEATRRADETAAENERLRAALRAALGKE